MNKLPMRFRILHFFTQQKKASVDDVLRALRGEYGGEGQFNAGRIGQHLASMRAAGLIEDRDVEFDAAGNLVQWFSITDFGASRMKFLPQAWRA